MARIAGVNVPVGKRVEIGLTYIFGIGRSTAQKILEEIDEFGVKLLDLLSARRYRPAGQKAE